MKKNTQKSIKEKEKVEINSSEFYNLSASKKISSGDFKGAIKDLNKASIINPEDGSIYQKRGVARSQIGNHQEALEDFHLSPCIAKLLKILCLTIN